MEKRREKGRRCKKGGEKVPTSGLNIELHLRVYNCYPNLIFNDVTVAALILPIIIFMSQVHEVKGNHS